MLASDSATERTPPTSSTVAVEAEARSNAAGDVGKQQLLSRKTTLSLTRHTEPPREFFHDVNLERTEAMYTTRGPGKPKVVSDSKPGPKLQILKLTREAIIESILEVHGLQERYVCAPAGPPFCVTYKGLTYV